ncbi:uncharacterized protein BJ171DRAFT_219325 [Polychytrium aggregatum]|uniref:uncharacterized protein n=1 Tax=Polychytrium aggregatum TaxID=110093 RepID=UPI0022FEA5A1|nr:uncharacterized protein BJ171DRAFT_219325 [Polychytrium aggregatum]KAI9199269.1 hypothetical protein BJ171DRAFT_219325 [Polychytrium aggregatum]
MFCPARWPAPSSRPRLVLQRIHEPPAAQHPLFSRSPSCSHSPRPRPLSSRSSSIWSAPRPVPAAIPQAKHSSSLALSAPVSATALPNRSIPVPDGGPDRPLQHRMEVAQRAHILWDIENCAVPSGTSPPQVVRQLRNLILGRKETLINIIAIADLELMNRAVKTALGDCGVALQNVSSRRPSAADNAILCELMKISFFQKPPHSIYLISGDRDFGSCLSFLESVQYHVVLIHPPRISDALRYCVRELIPWSEIAVPSTTKLTTTCSATDTSGDEVQISHTRVDYKVESVSTRSATDTTTSPSHGHSRISSGPSKMHAAATPLAESLIECDYPTARASPPKAAALDPLVGLVPSTLHFSVSTGTALGLLTERSLPRAQTEELLKTTCVDDRGQLPSSTVVKDGTASRSKGKTEAQASIELSSTEV